MDLMKQRRMKMNRLTALLRDEEGATAIEYGLIAGLIAVVIIGAVYTLGDRVSTTFGTITSGLEDPSSITP